MGKSGVYRQVELEVESSEVHLEAGWVKDPKGFAIALAWARFPFLMATFREEVNQELDILVWQLTGEVTIKDWSSVIQAQLYQLARQLGFARPRGSAGYMMRDLPLAFMFEEAGEEIREEKLEMLFGSVEIVIPGRWFQDAYEFCRHVLGGDFTSTQQRVNWHLFNAWLSGWSQDEITFAFGMSERQMKNHLKALVAMNRERASVKSQHKIRMPRKLGFWKEFLLNLSKGGGEVAREGMPRFVISPDWSIREIQDRFGVSRQTAWRSKIRGWLVPGLSIPDKPVNPSTYFNLETYIGRRVARGNLLARDGWWVEFGVMWCNCGICGEPAKASRVTIDHIYPRSEGGRDTLENFQLAHEDCNKQKGSNLPNLLGAYFPNDSAE
jgi:5-methylcytosine-specific restriction endonuclease McrA